MNGFMFAKITDLDRRSDWKTGVAVLDSIGETIVINRDDFRHISNEGNKIVFTDNKVMDNHLKIGDRIAIEIPDSPYDNIKFCGLWGMESEYEKVRKEKIKLLYRVTIRNRMVGSKEWGKPYIAFKEYADKLGELAYKQLGKYRYSFKGSKTEENVLWEVSYDKGETWIWCDCPDEYANAVLEY